MNKNTIIQDEAAKVDSKAEEKKDITFDDLGLEQKILDAVKKEGYTVPSSIQRKAIPPAIEGRDILGCAQTGTGKTAAFALPILQRLMKVPVDVKRRKIRALVLTPTRELALQIQESFVTYGKYTPLRCDVIMGGVSQYLQVKALNRGEDILIATPGRLIDLYNQGSVDLKSLECFVLDEADRMLDMGFLHDVKRIIEVIPKVRQTMFFTATLPPEIIKLSKTLLNNPVEVTVTPVSSTVDMTKQAVYFTDKVKKTELLIWLMKSEKLIGSSLIFTRTKYGADRLVSNLTKEGITAMAIHGDKSQAARQHALDSFKNGKIKVLIATDIAARGIDIEDLTNVVNFELPNVPETYVHRIGRTGRAGKEGFAVSLCDFDEKEYLKDIEKLIKKKIAVEEDNPYEMKVFIKSPPKVPQARPPRRPDSRFPNQAKGNSNKRFGASAQSGTRTRPQNKV